MAKIMSIHPHHVQKIFSGEKTTELRRVFNNKWTGGETVYIYATAPVKAIVGKFTIKKAWKHEINAYTFPDEGICLTEDEFYEYFKGKDEGWAIEIMDPQEFSYGGFKLAKLRKDYNFRPPQSYMNINWNSPQKLQKLRGLLQCTDLGIDYN